MESSIGHFQRSIELATSARDFQRACWSRMRLLPIIADRCSLDGASPFLAETRDAVAKAGDSPDLLPCTPLRRRWPPRRTSFRWHSNILRAARALLERSLLTSGCQDFCRTTSVRLPFSFQT